MSAPRATMAPELRGTEVILVVEDEPAVRALIGRTLRDLGYTVIEAKDGEDALIGLQKHHGTAHGVICDLVMPQLGGGELIGMLHDWYPQLKVLVVSGHSEATVADQGGLFPGARYLGKPFSADTLARSLRQVLDS